MRQAGNSVLGRGNSMSPAPGLYQGFFAGNVCWPIPSMVLGWGDPVGPRGTCGSSLGVDGIAWGHRKGIAGVWRPVGMRQGSGFLWPCDPTICNHVGDSEGGALAVVQEA